MIKILLSILSAIFYRLGGLKGFNTKFRDFGCPTIALLFMLKYGSGYSFWTHFLAFGLTFGALTTYWDKSKNKFKDTICQAINWQYPEDNFYLHGYFVGIAYIPYVIERGFSGGLVTPGMVVLTLRALLLGILMGGLNYLVHNKIHVKHTDWIEELFRGLIIVATLQMLL